jgi:hypothetical protein
MKHAVSTLERALLDAAVALAEGWRRGSQGLDGFRPDGQGWLRPARLQVGDGHTEATEVWQLEPSPWSTTWSHGGWIIERELIALEPGWMALRPFDGWNAWAKERHLCVRHHSPLIAAMRAYVASKFGAEVELP